MKRGGRLGAPVKNPTRGNGGNGNGAAAVTGMTSNGDAMGGAATRPAQAAVNPHLLPAEWGDPWLKSGDPHPMAPIGHTTATVAPACAAEGRWSGQDAEASGMPAHASLASNPKPCRGTAPSISQSSSPRAIRVAWDMTRVGLRLGPAVPACYHRGCERASMPHQSIPHQSRSEAMSGHDTVPRADSHWRTSCASVASTLRKLRRRCLTSPKCASASLRACPQRVPSSRLSN